MEIYQTEIDDGVSRKMRSSNSIAYTVDIKNNVGEDVSIDLNSLANLMQNNFSLALENEQPDLHYIYSILATLGWNLNDDIFLREEVVAAKNTPVDKPFNRMHQQEDIIGHMTSSRLLDSEYKESSDEVFEHIAVNSVIYKAWRDKDRREAILQTIAEIQEGKWKVSMECMFSKFDYGIITADGKQLIVERTPETSYLTKHLKAYGGTGTYQNKRVGRVLRNITFCGKGLVDNPGNPYSIIFNNNKKFFGAVASFNELTENNMSELNQTQAEIDKLKLDLGAAQSALAEFKAQAFKDSEAKLTQAISERDAKITTLQADFNSTMAKLTEANEKITAAEAAKLEIVTAHEKVVTELAKIEAERTLANRKVAIAGVVAADRVESVLAKVGSFGDEAFNAFIQSLSEFKPFVKKDDEKKEDKKDNEKTEKEDAKADFAKAELDKDGVNGHAEASAKKQKDDMQTIIKHITNQLGSNKAKKGDK